MKSARPRRDKHSKNCSPARVPMRLPGPPVPRAHSNPSGAREITSPQGGQATCSPGALEPFGRTGGPRPLRVARATCCPGALEPFGRTGRSTSPQGGPGYLLPGCARTISSAQEVTAIFANQPKSHPRSAIASCLKMSRILLRGSSLLSILSSALCTPPCETSILLGQNNDVQVLHAG